MTGGSGADRFAFNSVAFGDDTITDCEDGLDRISLAGSAAVSIDDPTIEAVGEDAHITAGDSTLIVLGGARLLDAADIVF